jgi:hypothetical protein
MTRRLIRTWLNFRQYNPDVLRCTILDVKLENNEVMLLKFCSDPNLTSCHEHMLSRSLLDEFRTYLFS